MAQDDLVIDPWGSAQSTDYDRIIDQFGLTSMEHVDLVSPSNFTVGASCSPIGCRSHFGGQRTGEAFGVLTGLMPSGQMHLGHRWWWSRSSGFNNKAAMYHAVADLESQATRGVSSPRDVPSPLRSTLLTTLHWGLTPRKPTSTSIDSARCSTSWIPTWQAHQPQ